MLDVPTSMGPDEAIATVEAVWDRIGWRHVADLGPFHVVSVDDGMYASLPSDDIAFEPRFRVVDGRLMASLAFTNLERECVPVSDQESSHNDPTEGDERRISIELLFDTLTRICDAPIGTFVGSLRCENDEGDTSPLVVTSEGVRMLRSQGDLHRSDAFAQDDESFPDQASVPEDLLSRSNDWHWEVDVVALKRRLRAIAVDGRPTNVLTRLP